MIGNISDCDVNFPSPEALADIFNRPSTFEWTIKTPSRGRSGIGRKNRGRILPKGRADRRMFRHFIRHCKLVNEANTPSLYEFLSREI